MTPKAWKKGAEVRNGPLRSGTEAAHCHFFFILLMKAAHKASSDSRGEEIDSIS